MRLNNTITNIEGVISFGIKQAERHGLEEVRITVPRARQMLIDLRNAKKEYTKPKNTTPRFFSHLDEIHA